MMTYSKTITSLVTLLTFQFLGQDDVKYPDYGSDSKKLKDLEADFILVGAGSAGGTLAGRLTEINKWEILSIEAGESPSLLSEVPKLLSYIAKTSEDWAYTNKEERACKAQLNGRCYSPRGKALGGSSTTNGMIYVRGSKKIFNRWRDLHGCTGWGYDDLLPYFKKAEGNSDFGNDTKYHSSCGPLCVSHYTDTNFPNYDFFERAASELNPPIPVVDDINGDFVGQGYVRAQGTQCDGRRSNTAKAYIQLIKNQPNYRLIKNSIVTKVFFNGTRAIGVEFYRAGTRYVAKARKEVIVSAGSFGSPTLLQLSGIGNKDVLTKNNIPIVHELPHVGRSLADHIVVVLWYTLPNIKAKSSEYEKVEDILEYYHEPRRGRYSGVGALSSISFLSISPNGDAIIETAHGYFEKYSLTPDVTEFYNLGKEATNAIMAANKRGAVALTETILLEPRSRGVVDLHGLTGVDAFHNISINYGYFSDPDNRDRNVLIKAMQDQLTREQTPTFKNAGATLIQMPFCFKKFKYGSYEFCDCYIDYMTTTIYHPVGTCRMGQNPSKSVVNLNSQVHGIDGLRVIDASIFPELTWGNTNAPTIAVAEKLADQIKMDYNMSTQPSEALLRRC